MRRENLRKGQTRGVDRKITSNPKIRKRTKIKPPRAHQPTSPKKSQQRSLPKSLRKRSKLRLLRNPSRPRPNLRVPRVRTPRLNRMPPRLTLRTTRRLSLARTRQSEIENSHDFFI